MITRFEECELALKNYFSGFSFTRSGITVNVPVIFNNPQTQFKAEEYPAIVLNRAGDYPDNSRWDNNPLVTDPVYDELNNLVSVNVRNNPEPINIYYTVRTYTVSERERALLATFVRKKLHRCASLILNGYDAPIEQVSYRNPDSSSSEFGSNDKDENRERIDQYLIKVETRIDLDTPRTVKTVQQVVVNITGEEV